METKSVPTLDWGSIQISLDLDVRATADAVLRLFFGHFCIGCLKLQTDLSERKNGDHNEEKLDILIRACQVLGGELSTQVAFRELLQILKLRCGAIRSAVLLLDVNSHDIHIEA